MSIPRRGAKVLREEGITSLAEKSTSFLCRKIKNRVERCKTYLYSNIARVLSPTEYRGVLIPTSEKTFGKDIRSRFIKGTYESEEVKAINKHLGEARDIIDLGASTGFLTVYLINMFDRSVRAIAVEGNRKMIPVLKKVRSLNNGNFEIESSAYHSSLDTVNFNVHHLTVGGSIQRETKNKEKVNAISLKDIAEKYKIEDFICIVDIEGGEADLINNELRVLEKRCRMLFVEFHEGYAEGVSKAKQALEMSNLKMIDNVDGIHVYKANSAHLNKKAKTKDKSPTHP